MGSIETQTQESNSSYSVKLDVFEGPLDLLLFLIKRDKIDIYDIPIAHVTKQYLEYIELMKELNLEIAGEFIVMAATLMRIKVRMLLPKTQDEEEEEDPREELVSALLEYRKFKEAAQVLKGKEAEQSRWFPRSDFTFLDRLPEDQILVEASLPDLIFAFKRILDSHPKETFHTIDYPKVSVEERIEYVLNCLAQKDGVVFTELFSDTPIKLVMVVTFMAVLELIRLQKIYIRQTKHFAEIWVFRNEKS
ncbi:MAG: segregation/condensation protein A [candidate division Zixibacteria bacterium]|nr:segregation/condensation protein A [candidate division Zixibacteria bacterium]